MAIRDVFKVSWRTFFNPRMWTDYDTVKEQNKTLWQIATSALKADKATRQETFAEACKRLQLSENDLIERAKQYRFYAISFALLGVIALLYAFFLAIHYHSIAGFIIGIAAAGLLCTYAFRYDFWHYQIHERRLGISITEWRQHLLGGKRHD